MGLQGLAAQRHTLGARLDHDPEIKLLMQALALATAGVTALDALMVAALQIGSTQLAEPSLLNPAC